MTLLIILGILVVASVATGYYFRDLIFLSEWDRARAESLAVPEEAQELHDYLSACVSDMIQEPVLLIGQQGGYVTIPSDPIGAGDHNPFSNALEIFSDTDFKTMYWYYVAANGVEHSQVPTTDEMEQELAAYVTENIANCANNFTAFTTFNASVGEISTDVNILDDQVLFTVHYPVHIELEDFTFDFDAFYESVDVPLGDMYNAAVEILDEENAQFFLEELTYDAFVLYDELPLSWTEFSCDQQEWPVDDVEKNLKEILTQNLRAVKVRNTDYSISEKSDEQYFEYNLLDTPRDNLHVNVLYSENWPLSMQVYPEENGVIEEDTLTGTGFGAFVRNFFCLSSYNVIYDLKYPVLVTLYDDASDYTFQFATMVVLDNNQPRKNTQGLLDIDAVGGPICEDATMPITVRAVGVEDDGTLVELDDADITFTCITSNCPLGKTEGVKGDAILAIDVPQCVNAQIRAAKDGYQDGFEVVSTLEEQDVTVVLEKQYNLSYDIKLVDFDGNVQDLASDDTVFVTLAEEDTGYSTSVSSPSTEGTVILIPGTYTISGQLVTDSPFDILIDQQAYTKCTSLPTFSIGGLFGLEDDASCTDVTIEQQQLDQAAAGGLTLHWTPDRDELAAASHIIIYVTTYGEPQTEDDLDDLLTLLELGVGGKEPELS